MEKWKKSIKKLNKRLNPYRLGKKSISLLSLLTFLVMIFSPVGKMLANPLVPYALLGEEFDPTTMNENFQQADNFQDVNSWNSFIDNRIGVLKSDWESRIDKQIEDQLLTATQSDAYLSNPAYKDYLEKELTSRKQDLLENWENSANSIVETERNNFVSLLSRNLLSEEIANSQNDTKKAGDISITNLNMVQLTYHDKLIPLFIECIHCIQSQYLGYQTSRTVKST